MGETRLSIAFWDGGGRQGDSGALSAEYTNLAYWTFNDDVNDVDVDREAPCTLFGQKIVEGVAETVTGSTQSASVNVTTRLTWER